MTVIKVVIEKNEEAYFAYTNQIDGCVAGGNTIDEVIINFTDIFKLFTAENEDLRANLNKNTQISFQYASVLAM